LSNQCRNLASPNFGSVPKSDRGMKKKGKRRKGKKTVATMKPSFATASRGQKARKRGRGGGEGASATDDCAFAALRSSRARHEEKKERGE